jgi:DNA-directed RNA polymerase subunit RPC12/RpoP
MEQQSMNIQKVSYFEKIESESQQQFIEMHNHCALCGTVLELQHRTDVTIHEIKEEAKCPECEIKARTKIYILN